MQLHCPLFTIMVRPCSTTSAVGVFFFFRLLLTGCSILESIVYRRICWNRTIWITPNDWMHWILQISELIAVVSTQTKFSLNPIIIRQNKQYIFFFFKKISIADENIRRKNDKKKNWKFAPNSRQWRRLLLWTIHSQSIVGDKRSIFHWPNELLASYCCLTTSIACTRVLVAAHLAILSSYACIHARYVHSDIKRKNGRKD